MHVAMCGIVMHSCIPMWRDCFGDVVGVCNAVMTHVSFGGLVSGVEGVARENG